MSGSLKIPDGCVGSLPDFHMGYGALGVATIEGTGWVFSYSKSHCD